MSSNIETTYTVTDGQLTIATASGVTAADVTGVAGLIGLPETMTGDVTHTVTVDGDQMKLTVMFADKMIGEFMLDSTSQEQLGLSPDSEINPMALGMAVGANSLKAPENEAEFGIEAETEVETETKAETQAETMIETETGAEAETKTETETEVETETKAETETEVETVTKTETETEVETVTKAETES